MHEHIRHRRMAEGAGGLRHLVLVVGEHQINPAAMDVEHFAQMFPAHRRAFDMPARTSRRGDPAGGRPARFALFGRLPQHEIGRVLFVGRDIDPRTGNHVIERAVGQRAIARQHTAGRVLGGGRKQHMAFGNIGKTAFDQPLDDLFHLVDMLCGTRLDAGRQAAQSRDIRVELAGGGFGHPTDRLVQRQSGKIKRRTLVDLVIDIGDVAHIGDMAFAIEMPQQAKQHIEHDDRPRIADMGKVIHRRSADIHAHIGSIDRRKGLLGAGQGIVKLQGHQNRPVVPWA